MNSCHVFYFAIHFYFNTNTKTVKKDWNFISGKMWKKNIIFGWLLLVFRTFYFCKCIFKYLIYRKKVLINRTLKDGRLGEYRSKYFCWSRDDISEQRVFTNKSQSYIHRTQSRGVNRRLDSPWTLLNTFTSVWLFIHKTKVSMSIFNCSCIFSIFLQIYSQYVKINNN